MPRHALPLTTPLVRHYDKPGRLAEGSVFFLFAAYLAVFTVATKLSHAGHKGRGRLLPARHTILRGPLSLTRLHIPAEQTVMESRPW